MGNNFPTSFLNADTVTARKAEIGTEGAFDDYPGLTFADPYLGGNNAGSCSVGIGISTNNINPKLSDWTLLDQSGVSRAEGQNGQHIGGSGLNDPQGAEAYYPIFLSRFETLDAEMAFGIADSQAAPDSVFNSAGNIINKSDSTIEIGERLWGIKAGVVPSTILAIGGGTTINLYNAQTFAALSPPSAAPASTMTRLRFSPARGFLLYTSASGGERIAAYETAGFTKAFTSSSYGSGYGGDFTPDDGIAAFATTNAPYINRFETVGWTILPALAVPPTAACNDVRFSNDGTMMAVAQGGTLIIYETTGYTQIQNLAIGMTGYGLSWSGDDSLLAIYGKTSSPYVKVFNTSTWTALPDATFSTEVTTNSWYNNLSPNGLFLAVVSDGTNKLVVYDTATWTPVLTFTPAPNTFTRSVGFSANSGLMFVGSESNGTPFLTTYETVTWTSVGPYTPIPTGNCGFGDFN